MILYIIFVILFFVIILVISLIYATLHKQDIENQNFQIDPWPFNKELEEEDPELLRHETQKFKKVLFKHNSNPNKNLEEENYSDFPV